MSTEELNISEFLKEFLKLKKKPMKRNESIITEAKALRVVGKHAGSKPISRLLSNIARAHYSATN